MPQPREFGTERRRFQLFCLAFTSVVVSLPAVLWSIGQFTVRGYAVAVSVWLLVSSEVFAPPTPDADWWDHLQWLKIVALIVLAYVVFERVSAVL